MEAELPCDLEYLAPIAELYGSDDLIEEGARLRMADKLRPNDLATLAALYNEIRRRGDSHRVAAWLWSADAAGRHWRMWWAVRVLFLLFTDLEARGVPPFSSGSVVLDGPRRVPLDWTKLPSRLMYLAEPAALYGAYRSDDEVDQFCGNVSAREMADLTELARRIVADAENIEEWMDRWPMTVHRESEMVYFMQGVIDRLGLFG